ncbi:HAMP domain-containing histidine kinase [Luteolibacter yonseiensis]|uniref:histidine kinase n=1 Tax=Luteolibacter yonseiensis TaxID=1144680 RepID=A0A934VCL4_9BACT|nr:HAMP domain-containing sensor histidine kinase [Luteolibacter yonseiensis]MBK1816609.1 HAMP domain-containing histidine kinase [Luteolibacter yonseiensis]
MATARAPLKRFLLLSLWVVLPFCALAGLSWNAWRADAETRRTRLLEEARESARQGLQAVSGMLGDWSAVPTGDVTGDPPQPDDGTVGGEARRRYESGDFEGVLGSPDSVKSAAGLPLRSLAALQLIRKETEPKRLMELSRILTDSPDFLSPLVSEEAESRFAGLKIPVPGPLADWRQRWRKMAAGAELLKQIRRDETRRSALWLESGGASYLVELRDGGGEWRVSEEGEVRTAAADLGKTNERRLPDGLAISVSIGGKPVAGPVGKPVLATVAHENWQSEVVLADEDAYLRGERRTRNIITGVIGLAGLAVGLGLVLAGRAYSRAVELARRQSEFMAAVSHEIRTPLTAMQLLAENLESGVADRSGQRADHTRMIREECARLGELVGNVLVFTRGGKSGPYEVFDVAAMVADAVSLVRPMAGKRSVRLEQEIAAFPEPPVGDVAALRRVLLNLLDNALKHTPAGGAVTCRAFPLDQKRWSLEVADSGPGIPAGERIRIFEPFYRIGDELRRSTPGTGLGLALVRRTAEAHGGSVAVGDSEGGGAVFSILLPIHPDEGKREPRNAQNTRK